MSRLQITKSIIGVRKKSARRNYFPIITAVSASHEDEYRSNSSTRGHAFKLSKHFCRVNCRAFSFTNRFIDVRNSLENDIVTAPSPYSFKCRLKKSVDFNKFVCVA